MTIQEAVDKLKPMLVIAESAEYKMHRGVWLTTEDAEALRVVMDAAMEWERELNSNGGMNRYG